MKPFSMTGAWSRRSIQTRVVLLVGLGMLSSLAILGATSWMLLRTLTDRVAAGRQLLASVVANHVDFVLEEDLQTLQGLSSTLRLDLSNRDKTQEQTALREAYLRSHLLDCVFLYSPDGTILTTEPTDVETNAAVVAKLPEVETAFRTGRPMVSNLAGTSAAAKRLYVLVPLRSWRGEVVALAGGELNPNGARMGGLLRNLPLEVAGAVDLVDATGLAFGTVRERGRSASRGNASDSTGVAQLQTAPWSVLVYQAVDESAGPASALGRWLLGLGPALLGLALLFAWGAASSVRRSLAVLTRSAARIAAGEMTEAIPTLGDDEVGRLGRSLDHMRLALKSSLESVAQANQALEQRVQERTQELEKLYRRLQVREEWRGELLRKVISAQEDERKRIARELHDETSQTLSALAIGIETALAAYPSDVSRERLVEAKALTVRTIGELHRLIYDLRPSVLDDLGLLSAIRWYAERHLEPRGISVRWEFSGADTRLAPELETALFRVVQEAVTNIAKHADAETVLIQCTQRDGALTIEIEDDGSGFDLASLPPPGARERGLGLMGMRERVELLGGSIEIDSAPGRGARVAVTVPVGSERSHVESPDPHR